MSSPGFYRAFEDRYRGSRDLIRKRLEAYLPFVAPLRRHHAPTTALDLGCGRGEWLELLRDHGFAPHGIDLDEGMLAAAAERGLPVTRGDALAHMKSLAGESLSIVSGFHIAEHLAFDDLEALVIEALRVLQPGGLLILETPNPENLVVGTSRFYLDPTHLRPLPPLLLSFLPEHHGFARVCTVRLQERPELRGREDIGLMDVLEGVSPDYAVVAQKAAAPTMLADFDAAFEAPHGLQLQQLAQRHDAHLARRITALEQRLAGTDAAAYGMGGALGLIASLQEHLAEARAELARRQTEAQQLQDQALAAARQLERLQASNDAMRQSWSWRITAPLRLASGPLLRPESPLRDRAGAAAARGMALCRRPLAYAMAQVLSRPRLSQRVNQWLLDHFPGLQSRLVDVASNAGIFARYSGGAANEPEREQAAPDGFSEFVAHFLTIPDREALPPMLRRHGRFHARQPENRTSRHAGIRLDHDLIHALRTASVVQARPYNRAADAGQARRLIQHIYLALLRRYPSKADEDERLNRLARGERIETTIAGIRKSKEHQSIQGWE